MISKEGRSKIFEQFIVNVLYLVSEKFHIENVIIFF